MMRFKGHEFSVVREIVAGGFNIIISSKTTNPYKIKLLLKKAFKDKKWIWHDYNLTTSEFLIQHRKIEEVCNVNLERKLLHLKVSRENIDRILQLN